MNEITKKRSSKRKLLQKRGLKRILPNNKDERIIINVSVKELNTDGAEGKVREYL